MSAPSEKPAALPIADAVTPLQMIFWGGLICAFDLAFSYKSNGTGFRFDILNDAVGTYMIVLAVFQLAKLSEQRDYKTAFAFVKVVSIIACVRAIGDHFIVPPDVTLQMLLQLASLATFAGTVTFCFAMRWLSAAAGLKQSEQSWRTTTNLYLFIHGPALVIGALLWLATLPAGRVTSRGEDALALLPFVLLTLLVMVIPTIHFLISTARMQGEIEARQPALAGPEVQNVWVPYDPTWLAQLVRQQLPHEVWLAHALAACTKARWQGQAYAYFVDSTGFNEPGSQWQFAESIVLHDPVRGTIVLDILKNGRVGGAEFLAKQSFHHAPP